MANFQFFSVQGSSGCPSGPDPANRVGDLGSGNPGRPVSSGFQEPRELGYFRAKQGLIAELSAAFFLQNVLQFHQER